jgi:hypothetical protein
MIKLKSALSGAILAVLFSSHLLAQGVGQLGSGQLWANPTASQRIGQPTGASAYFDFVYGSTRGAVLERGASGWAAVNPSSTAGLPWVSNGAGADPAYGAVVAAALPLGVATNTLNTQTANYTIVNTDCGKTIQAGTGSSGFFGVVLPAVGGFATNCVVIVVNGDTGRGKLLSGFPTNANTILWPRQTIVVGIVNGAWATLQLPGRWKTASGALTVNTDFTNGNDANDGLATGAGNALKTIEGALSVISNYFDLNGTGSPTQVTILMAAGSTDSQGVHQSFHSFVGANGGAAVKIDGNGGSITAAVQLYFGTVLQFRNITFSNAAGNCLQVFWGAKTYILDAVTFGACTGAQLQVASGAGHLEFINNFTITGSSGFFIIADTGASVQATAAITASFSTTATYTYFVLSASPAYTNLQSVTWNLNGHTITGQKANIQLNGVLLQSTATLAVTGAVSGTAAVCRLTMASTASLAESQRVIVAAIAGATGCNVTAAVHIVDATHIELTGTTFGGAYTSGGTVQIGLPGTTDPATSTGGQVL